MTKLRKLLKHPIRYFADAIDKRAAKVTVGRAAKTPVETSYSLVLLLTETTCRLDRALDSIVGQLLPLRDRGEIILVDTGASEEVGRMGARFADKHVDNCRYVKKVAH